MNMLDGLVDNTNHFIHANPWLALVAVFVAGGLTASNPCVLAMIPLMMSFVAGERDAKPSILRACSYSLTFVVGLAITFTALGVFAALAGKLYGDVSHVWNWIVAVVCVAMGLHLMDLVNVPIPALGAHMTPRARGLVGALLLGLLFGLVSAPCAGPVLIVLLTYLAGAGASVTWGALLLLVYALGHSVLVLAAGTSMGAARALIENRNATRVLAVLRRAAGAVIVLVGLYFGYQGIST